MKFTNVEKFNTWLIEVLKSEYFDLDAFLDEVERDIMSNGKEGDLITYEVGGSFTKSGKPELYYWIERKDTFFRDGKVVSQEDIDDGADYDDCTTEIIF